MSKQVTPPEQTGVFSEAGPTKAVLRHAPSSELQVGIGDASALLHRTVRKLEHSRIMVAQERALANSAAALAQDRLLKIQDLQAEVFRLNEQLKLARLDADESYSRVLDLEADLRREQASYVALQQRTHEVGENLRQVLATHAHDNANWKAQLDHVQQVQGAERLERQQLLESATNLHGELERARSAHHNDNRIWEAEVQRHITERRMETDSWQAEVARLQALHDNEISSWQAKVERSAADHRKDNEVWQAEVQRVTSEHGKAGVAWQAEVDRVTADHAKDNEVWQAEVARVQDLHVHDSAAWRDEIEKLNGQLARLAEEHLACRRGLWAVLPGKRRRPVGGSSAE